MEPKPHLPSHNRRLSPQERLRGAAAVEAIAPSLEKREDYVRSHGLDPEFSLPAANWGTTGFIQLIAEYARMLRKDPQNFDLLRFNVMYYSGFDLFVFNRYPNPGPEVWAARPPLILSPLPEGTESRLRAQLDTHSYIQHWSYLANLTPLNLIACPPPICGEIGWDVNGIIVNHDTLVYQERITLLHMLGLFRFLEAHITEKGVARVLEVGGGYGALAYYIKKSFPNVAYTICDLPESLSMAAGYLAVARPDLETHLASMTSPETDALDRFHFLPNYVLPELAHDLRFDLVINTLSLSEMSVRQIERYGALISQMISGTGIFFEQNQDNLKEGLANCKTHLPQHFLVRTEVKPPFPLGQGMVDLWANRRLTIPHP